MDFLIDLLVICGGFVLVIAGLFGLIAGVEYATCRGFQNATGIETQWNWACYAKVDGKWIPKANVFGNVNEVRIK